MEEKKKAALPEADCENCMYFDYSDDEGDSDKECQLNMDEDELVRVMTSGRQTCPYFRFWDKYKFVRKQN